MSFEAIKIPYQASTQHRFEVAKDPYSRERLHTLLATHRELKEHIPFYAGMTLFGSLSKGKELDATVAEFSDVDVYTFVDVDKLQTNSQSFIENNEGLRLRVYAASVQGMRRLHPHMTEEDIVAIASMQYVQKVTEASLFKRSLRENPRTKYNVRSSLITKDRTYSIRDKVEVREETVANGDGLLATQLSFDVAAPFFYDIGGDLAPYRKAFLRELQTYPHITAENYWLRVYDESVKRERGDFIPSSLEKYYPKNVAEAVVFYRA